MRIGVVVFDEHARTAFGDERLANPGQVWASVAGGSPFQVENMSSDLNNDVIWWTNLLYDDNRGGRLSRSGGFRHEAWLRCGFTSLMSELGLDLNGSNGPRTARVMATLGDRVVQLATKRFGISELHAYRFNEDVANSITDARCRIPEQYWQVVDPIAEHGYVSTTCHSGMRENMSTITITRNRVRHARQVLATKLPDDEGWRLHEGSISEHNLEEMDTPFLVRCTVNGMDPIVEDILPIRSESNGIREWLTDVEWKKMREYANIKIGAVLFGDSSSVCLNNAIPEDDLAELSFSQGLLAEQVWTGVASRKRRNTGRWGFSAAAAWLRSADKMAMFEHVRYLHEQGVKVSHYGFGNMIVRYAQGELEHVIGTVIEAGLLPPLSKVQALRNGSIREGN